MDQETLSQVCGQLELALTDSTHNREFFRGVIADALEKLEPLLGNDLTMEKPDET